MRSKNYRLIIGILVLVTNTAVAQEGESYSVFDTSVISARKMPQQNEFWNNNYKYPAKPRSMWEMGASIGSIVIGGDVSASIPVFGAEVHARKALGYIFSVRVQYINGMAKGMNWKASQNYAKNPAWLASNSNSTIGNLPINQGYNPILRDGNGNLVPLNPNSPVQRIFYNYKTHLQDISLQTIITLNNIRFHKQKSDFVLYAGAGIGFTLYDTKVNALNESGKPYTALFQSQVSASGIYKNRRDILKVLRDGMDNTYETAAENGGPGRTKPGGNTVRPTGTVSAGVSFKLSKRINIALEDRQTFIKDDLLDGQQWQEAAVGDAVQTRSFDSYNFLSFGVNFNLGSKSVEPLWWLNPLDYAYSEINNPKHMKLPNQTFEDTDGDGVIDQLDREPNTSAGCPVDAHGVTKDTDGDGVPDCMDKQLITPSECQPVDADGVGVCPEPDCCTKVEPISNKESNPGCPADYPGLSMQGTNLDKDSKAFCTTIVDLLRTYPACSITITAYPGASKMQQSIADKKLDALKNYMVETLGLSADRITTDKMIGGGGENTINIKSNK